MKNLQKSLKKKKIGFYDDYDDVPEESYSSDVPEDKTIENLQNTINNNDQLIANFKQKLHTLMQEKIHGIIEEVSELEPESAEQLTREFQQFDSADSIDQYAESSKFIETCNQRLKSLLISKIMEQQRTIESQENEMSQYEQKKEHE